MKPNVKCFICDKAIYRLPCRQNGHNVCSYACRNRYFSGERSFVWIGGKRDPVKTRIGEKRRRIEYKKRAIEYLGGGCIDCGYSACIAALDFHHKNPETKNANIKTLCVGRWERVQTELDKCVLLCANCHRTRHWRERHENN